MTTVCGGREMRKVGNGRVRDALLYSEGIARDRCVESRVAVWKVPPLSRTRTCTRVGINTYLLQTVTCTEYFEYARHALNAGGVAPDFAVLSSAM